MVASYEALVSFGACTFLKKSILSAVLCFWIACLKACDKGCGSSSCICGNCDPELPLGMGFVFRNAPQPEIASQISAPEWDAVSRSGLNRKLHPGTSPQSGMNFPNGPHAETVFRNCHSERDALSGWHAWRKLRPSFGSRTGYIFRNGPRAVVYRPFCVRRLSNYVIDSYIIGRDNIAIYNVKKGWPCVYRKNSGNVRAQSTVWHGLL